MRIEHYELEKIKDLLLGRRIVFAEESKGVDGTGILVLDSGTEVFVYPNAGCCCGSGTYYIESIASCDNIITDVRLEDTTIQYDGTRYTIFVIAESKELNILTVEGDDGNGYYGTGFTLEVMVKS